MTGCGDVIDTNPDRARSLIGAENYDIGHIAFGPDGRRRRLPPSSARTRRAAAAPACPPRPVTSFAIDYVADEMGHQFNGDHTFNSPERCGGGNRSAGAVGRAGRGPSVMAYAGICGQRRPAAAHRPVLLAADPDRDHVPRQGSTPRLQRDPEVRARGVRRHRLVQAGLPVGTRQRRDHQRHGSNYYGRAGSRRPSRRPSAAPSTASVRCSTDGASPSPTRAPRPTRTSSTRPSSPRSLARSPASAATTSRAAPAPTRVVATHHQPQPDGHARRPTRPSRSARRSR